MSNIYIRPFSIGSDNAADQSEQSLQLLYMDKNGDTNFILHVFKFVGELI